MAGRRAEGVSGSHPPPLPREMDGAPVQEDAWGAADAAARPRGGSGWGCALLCRRGRSCRRCCRQCAGALGRPSARGQLACACGAAPSCGAPAVPRAGGRTLGGCPRTSLTRVRPAPAAAGCWGGRPCAGRRPGGSAMPTPLAPSSYICYWRTPAGAVRSINKACGACAARGREVGRGSAPRRTWRPHADGGACRLVAGGLHPAPARGAGQAQRTGTPSGAASLRSLPWRAPGGPERSPPKAAPPACAHPGPPASGVGPPSRQQSCTRGDQGAIRWNEPLGRVCPP